MVFRPLRLYRLVADRHNTGQHYFGRVVIWVTRGHFTVAESGVGPNRYCVYSLAASTKRVRRPDRYQHNTVIMLAWPSLSLVLRCSKATSLARK